MNSINWTAYNWRSGCLISVRLSGFLNVSKKAILSYYQSSSFTLLCGSVTVSGKDDQPCGGNRQVDGEYQELHEKRMLATKQPL